MKQRKFTAITLALGLALSAGAMAQSMTKDNYKAGKDAISAEYKSTAAGCSSFSGNAKDICVAGAKGREKIALADLEVSYTPTVATYYEARVARAEADYGVARQRCDDKAGNVKDVCVEEAKAAQTEAKADAKAQMKTTNANVVADTKSAEARTEAYTKTAEARKDATTDKMDAEYKVAREKCDTFSGSAKDSCVNQAKARFGKS
jgi:hypothetical protein